MAAINLTIDIPEFNFDIIQGQDLELPITYETEGVDDTLVGASLKMELRLPDYSVAVDSLSTINGRIVINGPNAFTILFPSAKSSAYKLTSKTIKYIYGLELTANEKTKRLFEGTITVKREQTK